MENTAWVLVQCDDELAIMFGTYAESKSAEIEINVIQRMRGEIERGTTRSQANSSQARCSETRGRGSSGSRGSSSGRNAGNSEASSVHEPTGAGPSSSKQSDVAPIIEEEAPDDVPTDDEDEILHPEFVIGKVPKGKEAISEDEDSIPSLNLKSQIQMRERRIMTWLILRVLMRIGQKCNLTEMILLWQKELYSLM